MGTTFFWNCYIGKGQDFPQLVAISISSLLISYTRYALHMAFGQPPQQLRDLFEEHEDWFK